MRIIPWTGLRSVYDLDGFLVEEGSDADPVDLSLFLNPWQWSLVWNTGQEWWLYLEGERITP